MMGTCDYCERQNIPVSKSISFGIEIIACYLCRGEADPDPYGEELETADEYKRDTAEIMK